ncbi:hypothetical protein TNCV_1695071 [Trichonephila clavipes]|nr:hypothetical protein TNCV_1695071 [Trichonephila clavipes]
MRKIPQWIQSSSVISLANFSGLFPLQNEQTPVLCKSNNHLQPISSVNIHPYIDHMAHELKNIGQGGRKEAGHPQYRWKLSPNCCRSNEIPDGFRHARI